jgi:hypothetical protein
MIIDSHVHLDSVNGVKDLILSMDKAGISKALVFVGELFNYSNEKLLLDSALFKERLFPLCSISPFSKEKPTLEQLEKWLANKEFFGLKFYTGYEYFYPADEIIRPYLKLAEKYNKPAIFHSGDTWNQAQGAKLKYSHPFNIDDLAVDMPDLKIIIAHFGYPWVMDTAEIVYKNKNVFTDCSGLFYNNPDEQDKITIKNIFTDYLRYGGTIEKLLFGTDWSLANQNQYVKLISEMPISAEEKEKIFYKNASEIFKI